MAQHPSSAEAQKLRDLIEGTRRRDTNGKEEANKKSVNPADLKKQLRDLEFRMTSGTSSGN